MSGATLSIDLKDLPALAKLKADQLAKLDLRKAFREIKLLLISDTKRNFAGAHGPDGTPWTPLKNPSKNRGGPGSKPLRDKGLLMASVSAGTGSGHVEKQTPTELVWGTNIDYASFHQFGTKTIPVRAFLGLGQRLQDKIERVVADHIETLLA